MRVGIVHPTVWPEARRGTERFIHEYARFLARRGHQVEVFAAGSGASREESPSPGVQVRRARRLWRPWMERFGAHEYHVFPLTAFFSLLGARLDLVHCFNFTDALAALALRRRLKAPVLLHLVSLPPEVEYRRVLSSGGRLLRSAVGRADLVLTVSDFQRRYFVERTGRDDMEMLHPPVDVETFRPRPRPGASEPTILFASAAEDRRKGVRVLFRAFARVLRERSEVRLRVASAVSVDLREYLLNLLPAEARERVEFGGRAELEELPRLLSEASLLALPSLWEACPLIVLEALASGTPAVGTAAGGIPELIGDPAVGRTFEPGPPADGEPSNVDGLAAALLDGLRLSERPETAAACRRAAERLSWEVQGPLYEKLCLDVVARRRAGVAGGTR